MDYKDRRSKRQLICPLIWAIISTSLLIVSLNVDYQYELIKEHTRFRRGFPSRSTWENPPDGNLNCYLFNVTNTEAFLNGTDTKLKLQQIGPIVYRIKAVNTNLQVDEEKSTLTYRKVRYDKVTFDEANSPPGILEQKIYIPNVVLLSLASRIHDWFFLARNAFNVYAKREPIFLHKTVHDFLWNYTTPIIDHVSQHLPGIMENAGMLHNAIREKVEVFTVNIGTKNGMENFFKIRSLNGQTIFSEHAAKGLKNPETCPIFVANSFDNTLFPPYLTREDRLSIVAGDSCRVLPLVYDSDVSDLGFSGYKFVVGKDHNASCLQSSMGIPLPTGLFDVASCVVDVPSAYSQPHFFGTTYNYEEHFEGLSPNAEDHQTFLLIEPKTGIPFEEKYRFQTNIPVPKLSGFSEEIRRFSGMIVPTFWYEYDLDDLPTLIGIMLKFSAYYSPYFQKLCIVGFLLGAITSLTSVVCRIYGISLRQALWFREREMKQTISEVPTNGRYYDESNSFLPKTPSKYT